MLPSGYQEVEYIKSNGTQWIDTGINQSATLGVDITFMTDGIKTDSIYFGCANGWRSQAFEMSENGTPTGYCRFVCGGNAEITNILYIDKKKYKMRMFMNMQSIDDVNFTYNLSYSAGTKRIYLCAANRGSTNNPVGFSYDYYLYECKLYSGAVIQDENYIVRHFVPCFRKTDGIIGMYDVINDLFYENAGTGTFEKGQNLLLTRDNVNGLPELTIYGNTHTLSPNDLPSIINEDGRGINYWYYDPELTYRAKIGDIITEQTHLYAYYNKIVNEVLYGGDILINLKEDTITESDVYEGIIFHKPNGQLVQGTKINNPIAEENDVIFYDYDGTIRYSYSLDEVQELTELPPAPNHTYEGLIFQEWNWTLEEIKEWGYECDIGAIYRTNDSKTHIFLDINEFTGKTITMSYLNSGTIEYGDGETYKKPTGYTEFTHTYSDFGIYDMKIGGDFEYHALSDSFCNAVKKIYSGANSLMIPSNLKYVEIISTSTNNSYLLSGTRANGDYNVTHLTIPRNCTVSQTNSLCDWYGLRSISFSPKCVTLDGNGLSNSPILKRLYLPAVSTMGGLSILQTLRSLEKVIFSPSLTGISSNAFRYTNLLYIRFTSENPPTLGNSYVFQTINARCMIFFPYASTAYLTATNYPNPATYAYIGVRKTFDGEVLPPGTGDYMVTWYSTKNDAYERINPIEIGNGKEVYCRYD